VSVVPTLLALLTVALQIAYPLLDGTARERLSVAVVVTFFAASVSHAGYHRGGAYTLRLVLVTGGLGLVAEAVGVRTGVPFGEYRYTGTLGPQLLGVPVVIPLAWTMMAYPAAVMGRRIARSTTVAVVVAALALTAWDLFLDPQMVAAGHWVWQQGGATIAGIPLVNYAGWFVTSLAIQALLLPGMPRSRDDRVPIALYLWTWIGSVIAHGVFLDAPLVAVTGGLGMGLVVAAFVRSRAQ
jgi:putative membrane protein